MTHAVYATSMSFQQREKTKKTYIKGVQRTKKNEKKQRNINMLGITFFLSLYILTNKHTLTQLLRRWQNELFEKIESIQERHYTGRVGRKRKETQMEAFSSCFPSGPTQRQTVPPQRSPLLEPGGPGTDN